MSLENCWSEVREISLFESVLQERLQRHDLRALGFAPRGARLLLAALLYHSRRHVSVSYSPDARDEARVETRADAAAVLLSYVMMTEVFNKINNNNLPKPPLVAKPIENPTTDQYDVTDADRSTAAAIMRDYISVPEDETEETEDIDIAPRHPLVTFQHYLSQLSELNAVCGAPLPHVSLRAAYAGPLARRLRRAVLTRSPDPRRALAELLSPAPTVLAFIIGLIDLYDLMSS